MWCMVLGFATLSENFSVYIIIIKALCIIFLLFSDLGFQLFAEHCQIHIIASVVHQLFVSESIYEDDVGLGL